MFPVMKRLSKFAAAACVALPLASGAGLAVPAPADLLRIPDDILVKFASELRANPGDAFPIFQLYVVTYPKYATALTARFLRGREELAPSIAAAAVVALSGAFAPNELIGDQVQGIAQVVSHAAPNVASDSYSTMVAASPQYNLQIVTGLRSGHPLGASALSGGATGGPQLASADLGFSQATANDDPNVSYSGDDPLVTSLFNVTVTGGTDTGGLEREIVVSEAQINSCVSAPCL